MVRPRLFALLSVLLATAVALRAQNTPDTRLIVLKPSPRQAGLTAVQTLFMREHNYWCDVLAFEHPNWNDETLYQWARKIIGAEIEVITYKEFLPAIMGSYAPSINGHYDPTVNASVATEFSTAGFRVGHTLLSPQILRIQNDGRPDPRPTVRENVNVLGNLVDDFDFTQAPRAPLLLPTHPKTDLSSPHKGSNG